MKLPDFDFSCVLESSDLPEPRQVLQMHNVMRSKGQKLQKSLKFCVQRKVAKKMKNKFQKIHVRKALLYSFSCMGCTKTLAFLRR